uniref:D-galactarate/Altronate dehydratase C-terminal domain-containing protein n=2 Tax=Chrysotila carterae TaxID=13221 RepID=A0A7S4BK84_CHRCT
MLLHPNVGAAVVMQTGADEAASRRGAGVCYEDIKDFAISSGRDEELRALPHEQVQIRLDRWSEQLERISDLAARLVAPLYAQRRSRCAPRHLIVAQQCGGSDAFSGTHANPLVAEASKLLIEAGGGALLAETDELIGAEDYVLSSVRDLHTANKFLALVSRFHAYTHAHGASAEGNPSGGNLYRGLYNIALKSLGAAMKRHATVRLEDVVEYAQPLLSALPAQSERGDGDEGERGVGYCFMDSPGNDLESVAGQVAAGCNVIYFTTGNGSITNFPFVPTIKVVSTHKRFELMADDMDVDAAASADRSAMAKALFELTLAVASGQATRGERSGYHQLQIWRDWVPGPPSSALAGVAGPETAVLRRRALRVSARARALPLFDSCGRL